MAAMPWLRASRCGLFWCIATAMLLRGRVCIAAASTKQGKDAKKAAADEEAVAKMRLCFDFASDRAKHRARIVQKVLDAATELATEDISHEEAVETLMLVWMTTCYETIDDLSAELTGAAASDNETLHLQLEERLMGPLPAMRDPDDGKKAFMESMVTMMSQPKKLLRLAKKIMREPANRTSSQSSTASPGGDRARITSPALVAVAVLLIGFTAAVLGVLRLSRGGSEHTKKEEMVKGNRVGKTRKTKAS